MDLSSTVEKVARDAAAKIYQERSGVIGRVTVVHYTQAEAEILIERTILLELRKAGLMK